MMGAVQHWAGQYIGAPWENGAQGPKSFDCWGFVRHVERVHFGRDLPIITVDLPRATARERRAWCVAVGEMFQGHAERSRWRPLLARERPMDGDGVTMAHSLNPWHVGVWADVDGGGVLHCQHALGVMKTTLPTLWAMGWNSVQVFRFMG